MTLNGHSYKGAGSRLIVSWQTNMKSWFYTDRYRNELSLLIYIHVFPSSVYWDALGAMKLPQ